MRISYEWTEREWDEAVRLAQRRSRRGTGLPGMTYALVGLPLLGAVLDLRSTLRDNRGITLAGSILPLVLVLIAVTAAALLAATSLRRRRMRSTAAAMPRGEWELVLQEAGWRCRAEASTTLARPEETEPPLLPWSDLVEARQGDRVVVFLRRHGFEAVPTRCLTPEQGGHMHRMVVRKLRPSL